MKRLTEEKRRALSVALKAFYDAVSAEPQPQCFDALLRKIK